jgi:hypothetical protein
LYTNDKLISNYIGFFRIFDKTRSNKKIMV